MTLLYVRPGHAPQLEAEVRQTGVDGEGWSTCGHTGRVRASCPCGAPGLGEWADSETVLARLQATCVTLRPPRRARR